jgi:hypothetical protein
MRESRQSDGVIAGVPIALYMLMMLLWSPPALGLDESLDISQYAQLRGHFATVFLNGAVYAMTQTADENPQPSPFMSYPIPTLRFRSIRKNNKIRVTER